MYFGTYLGDLGLDRIIHTNERERLRWVVLIFPRKTITKQRGGTHYSVKVAQ